MSDSNKEIVRQFLEYVGVGDVKTAFGMYATEDFTWWIPPSVPNGGIHEGKRAVLRDLMGTGGARVEPDSMSMDVRTMVADGDYVAVEWVSRFRTKNGKDYQNDYNVMFEVRNGKIEAVREYFDTRYSLDVLWS